MINGQRLYKYTRILERSRALVKEFTDAGLDPTDVIQLCVDADKKIKELSKGTFIIKRTHD